VEYRRLGSSGLKLSVLSYGSWVTFANQVDKEKAKELMRTAYDVGVNFFDNAEVYADGQSEEIMGSALADLGFSRDSYCVSSKVFWGGEHVTQKGLHRKHIMEACHKALKRLRVDYLDLYFCHRPDEDTPIIETVWAMHHLVEQGKILYWGTSEWSAQQIAEAILLAEKNNLIPPTMEQPQYNMFSRQRLEGEYLSLFEKYSYGTTIWSPLAGGILSGKYNTQIPQKSRANVSGLEWFRERITSKEGQEQLEKVKKMTTISHQLGCSMTQLAIAWCLNNPNVSTVLLGASSISQLKENLKSLDFQNKIDTSIMDDIDEILGNKPPPAPSY
jgi:voltage-dependent potassium channel beta subunit